MLGISSEQVAQPVPVVSPSLTPLAQLVERLTQEIHAAFGQEEWRTVLERSDLLLQEELHGMTPALWRERGLAYLALGDSQSALGALDEALQVDPFDIATLRGKGLALQHSGRGKEAIEVLERAYQLAPFTDPLQRLSLLGDLAGIQREEGDWRGVLQSVDEALRLAPDDPMWLRAKLEALAQLGREEEANALARDWAPRHLDVVNQWLQERYQGHLKAEDWQHARATVETGLVVAPGSRVWQQAQVEVARLSGQVEEGLTLAREMTESSSATTDDWVRLAALAAAANREEEVKSALVRAAALSGTDAAAVAQARKDYLVPFETARKRARRERISFAVVIVSLLLIVAVVMSVVLVNGARLRAQADATANALYSTVPHTTYSAPIPGGCGSNSASWLDDPTNFTDTCTHAGSVVTILNSDYPWGPRWLGPGHDFTFSYTVQVDIAQLSQQTCAGFNDWKGGFVGQYYFIVCDDGSWQITNTNVCASCTLLQGTIRASSTYHLKVIVDRNRQVLFINGILVGTTHDSSYSGTENMYLVVSSSGGASATNASATFSNFTYMPLPTS